MTTGAPVDAVAEELARGEAGQAEAFSAEVRLVGIPGVNRQSRHAVRATPTRGRGAGLSQRVKSLKSQRPLEDLGAHPNRVQAAAAQLARGECQVRTGQRTNQLGMVTDRKVDLDAARGQVPLHVRRLTGALDPDCPHHPRQSRPRQTLNVRLHYGHPRTEVPQWLCQSDLDLTHIPGSGASSVNGPADSS